MLKIVHKKFYTPIWMSRSRNYKGEVIEPPFNHYSRQQWNCISEAVFNTKSAEKWWYENTTLSQKECLKQWGILNCLDFNNTKNYQKPFTCPKTCIKSSQLIAKLHYQGKVFYILKCSNFNQIFFFWE